MPSGVVSVSRLLVSTASPQNLMRTSVKSILLWSRLASSNFWAISSAQVVFATPEHQCSERPSMFPAPTRSHHSHPAQGGVGACNLLLYRDLSQSVAGCTQFRERRGLIALKKSPIYIKGGGNLSENPVFSHVEMVAPPLGIGWESGDPGDPGDPSGRPVKRGLSTRGQSICLARSQRSSTWATDSPSVPRSPPRGSLISA